MRIFSWPEPNDFHSFLEANHLVTTGILNIQRCNEV